MTITGKSFREDINGLRAWAVLAVILYHFGITGFSGGFIGVDVFFVISGFLMTGIIASGLEASAKQGGARPAFSLVGFYLSRARRIIPALLFLTLILMIAGWFFLSDLEYKELGTHVISALGFFSNIKLWREVGYFDAASHEKLLLHTWSLSVEWQFYLILPLVLMALWRIRPGRVSLAATLALGLLLSLLLSIFVSPVEPTFAFYLLPTRAWEMLAGGLVYLLANPLRLSARTQIALETGGFSLIIAAILLFDASSNWPGWRALVPVTGTLLVLIAARQGSPWTGSRIAQWLGDCSYSLYLWHWPFAVALSYLQLQDHAGAILLGLALTLACGWLSYSLVETPARTTLTRMPQWAGTGALLAAICVVALPSLLVRVQQGIPGRLPAQISAVFNEAENKNPRIKECLAFSLPVPECTYGGDTLGVIVIGDSHAGAMIRSVEKALPDRALNVLDWTLASCPTILGIRKAGERDYRCDEFLTQAVNKQKSLPSDVPMLIINRSAAYISGPNEPERTDEAKVPLFYIGSPEQTRTHEFFQAMRDGMIEAACEFAKTRPVYMVRPTPELKIDVPKTMGRALMLGRPAEVSVSLEEYRQRNAFVLETQDMAAERCGVKILDPIPYLCSDSRCRGDVGGQPIYFDDDHLSERGGSLLIPMFRTVFEDTSRPNEAIARQGLTEAKEKQASSSP